MSNMPKKRDPRMNPSQSGTFAVDVAGIGRFLFNRKTYGTQIRIDAEIARILGPHASIDEPPALSRDRGMQLHAMVVGHYKALVVECPSGWEDLEALDFSEDPEDMESKIFDVYMALKEKLDSFRLASRAEQASPSQGAGDVPHNGVLGAQQVQPAADGSSLPGTDA